jgi:hypothetical protein
LLLVGPGSWDLVVGPTIFYQSQPSQSAAPPVPTFSTLSTIDGEYDELNTVMGIITDAINCPLSDPTAEYCKLPAATSKTTQANDKRPSYQIAKIWTQSI